MSTFFGLDFGTSNSTLAVNLNGAVKLLEIDPINVNPFSLKSILFFDEYTKILKFGQEAVDSYLENDALGRYIQSIKSFLPDKTFISTDVSGKSLNISDLVAIILREIKSRGEQIVGEEIGKIVLGRPVVFSVDKVADNLAEKRLLEAAKKAGFSDISFVFEPVAAAKACIVKSYQINLISSIFNFLYPAKSNRAFDCFGILV